MNDERDVSEETLKYDASFNSSLLQGGIIIALALLAGIFAIPSDNGSIIQWAKTYSAWIFVFVIVIVTILYARRMKKIAQKIEGVEKSNRLNAESSQDRILKMIDKINDKIDDFTKEQKKLNKNYSVKFNDLNKDQNRLNKEHSGSFKKFEKKMEQLNKEIQKSIKKQGKKK